MTVPTDEAQVAGYQAGDFQSGVSLSGSTLTGNSKWNTDVTPNGNYVVLKYDSDSAITGNVHKGTVIVDSTNKTILVPLDGNATLKISNSYKTVTISLSGVTKETVPETVVNVGFSTVAGDTTFKVGTTLNETQANIQLPGSDDEWGWYQSTAAGYLTLELDENSSLIGKDGKLSLVTENYDGYDFSTLTMYNGSQEITPTVSHPSDNLDVIEFSGIVNMSKNLTINVPYPDIPTFVIYESIGQQHSKFVY